MTKATKLLLFAFLAFATPSVGQVVLTPTGTILDDDASGDGVWATECAAADLHCIPFDDDGDITSWLINGAAGGGTLHDPLRADTDSNLVTFEAGDGCMGTGAVQIEDSDGVDESPVYLSVQTWPDATSAANITAAGEIEHVVGIGETVWARFCVNFSAALLSNDTNWAGHKIVSFTGAYNSNTAQEAFFMRNSERDYTSVSNSNSVSPWFSVAINGGIDFDYQPGSEFGLCYDEMEPLDCYIYDPDTWYVVRMALTPGAKTTPTTHITVDVAKYGDLDWTRIYDRDDLQSEDYEDDGPGGAEGYSAFLLWNRHENHDSQPTGITQKFSNLILTTAGEPALPDWDEWTPAAPSWFTDEPVNRWQEIPGTSAGDLIAADGTLPANAESYSGMAVDSDDLWFAPGGHALQANNAMYRLPLLAETTAWTKVMAGNTDGTPCTGGVADCTTNGTGAYDDGSKASDHIYGTHVGVGGDCSYFGIMGSAWLPASATFVSTAVWKWCLADIATRSGYTYLGKGVTGSISGLSTVESVSAYDAVAGKVYVVSQNGFQTPGPGWVINTADDSITSFGPYSGFAEYPAFAAVIQAHGTLLLGTASNTIKTMSLASPGTWTSRTVTGTFNTGDRGYPMVYSPAADQLLGRMAGDGNSIRYVTIPASVGGTYAAGTSSAAGGGDSPGDPLETQPFGRWNIVPDFGGSGDDLLLYWPNAAGPVYFQRISGPRS